jgi:hypothetical protein
MQNTPQQVSTRGKRISEVLAMAGMAVLLTRVLDVAAGQGTDGFLPMSPQTSGIFFGVSIAILFFTSFASGFRAKSRITTSLLISGGTLLAGFMLLAPRIGLLLYLAYALQPVYFTFITIGFVIIGLGILRAFRRQ